MIDLSSQPGEEMHDLLADAAAAGPLATDEASGATIVLRYADIDALAHDHRLAGVGLSMFDLMGISDGPLREWYGGLMFTNEGPAHHRLRQLVSRAFTPRSVAALRDDASAIATDAIAPVRDAGAGDLVDALGRVPIRVMCRLVGVPEADVEVFSSWADALSPVFGFMDEAEVKAATDAIGRMLDYCAALVDARVDEPGDDLITNLLAAEADGERLTRGELVSMVANLIVGGHDTTASQIGCTLLTLLRAPDAMARVRADGALLGSAIAETIRYEPSISAVPRVATAPFEVAGESLAAGSLLLLCTMAANREAGVWHDPATFDIERFDDPSTPKLLSFGAGPHYCLGASLARLTLEEVVRAVLGATATIEPADDLSAVPWRFVLGRSPAQLPVRMGR